MENILAPLLAILQLIFFGYTIYQISQSFSRSPKRSIHFFIVEVILFSLLIICFVNYKMSGFNHQNYFWLYSILTLISATFYWVNKLPQLNPIVRFIGLVFTATFHWIALLTAIKFIPYLPFIWFPWLGLMAFTPTLFILLTFSEIRFQTQQKTTLKLYPIFLAGLLPLGITYLILLIFTESSYQFIELFIPVSKLI